MCGRDVDNYNDILVYIISGRGVSSSKSSTRHNIAYGRFHCLASVGVDILILSDRTFI